MAIGKNQRLLGLLGSQVRKTLEEQYFAEVRPQLYASHGTHYQYGSRAGRTLAEHLDSACQFVLTVSKIAAVPEDKRGCILAATAVHDLNKLDERGRKVKTLARDREFLQAQLDRACVAELVRSDEDLELVRRLIERHSGHSTSDGMRYLPEDPQIKHWAAMLIGGDLFDLGIDEAQRIRKVENELTVALQRPTKLFSVKLTEDRGYLTSLLLVACERVLQEKGLYTLAIEPNGQIFLGSDFPEGDVVPEIAWQWQQEIGRAFKEGIKCLISPTTRGIEVDQKAILQDPDTALDCVDSLLVEKVKKCQVNDIKEKIEKYSLKAGSAALEAAKNEGVRPISTPEEFGISEGIKAIYRSYRAAKLTPEKSWDRILDLLEIQPKYKELLKPFDVEHGRCLFAATLVNGGIVSIHRALKDSFELRQETDTKVVSEEIENRLIEATKKLLNLPSHSSVQGIDELNAYIEASPSKRCSLGVTTRDVNKLISRKMPMGEKKLTKVQVFSNRLPGGMDGEPKRRGDNLSAQQYQLLAVGANLPKTGKQPPIYLHFGFPKGSSVELRRIWRNFLEDVVRTNEGTTIVVDELRLYRDNEVVFSAHKSIGLALPKRSSFVSSTVTIPITWGEASSSLVLLKSLRLALEMSLALDVGFPFILGSNLEIEPTWGIFGRVDGIPSSLQPLLGDGRYLRDGHLPQGKRVAVLTAERVLERLRCIGQLAVFVSSLRNKDDCLYDLTRAVGRPIELYYVLLRWILREQDTPNLEAIWLRIREPLNTLLEDLMSDEHARISDYLRQAARIAETAKLRGSSFRRTAKTEPFSEFVKAVRSRKEHMDWDTIFASLVEQYHKRLDRIRGYEVGATKHEQIEQFYQVLRALFEDIYHSRSERLLADGKTLEAAYLFFLQEVRRELKAKEEADNRDESQDN